MICDLLRSGLLKRGETLSDLTMHNIKTRDVAKQVSGCKDAYHYYNERRYQNNK